jgi:t-SNARE complex subunit (syntaxin)
VSDVQGSIGHEIDTGRAQSCGHRTRLVATILVVVVIIIIIIVVVVVVERESYSQETTSVSRLVRTRNDIALIGR